MLRWGTLTLSIGMAAGAVFGASSDAESAPFSLTSPSFRDGGALTRKNAADDPMRMCGGQNVSPALAWSNVPARTRSFVIFLQDPDGLLGQGVSHWVGYGIPANVTSLAEGELTRGSNHFVGGKGTRDNSLYIGPCPPAGEAPHHYIFTIVATDLEPLALKPGMTREEVYAAIKGRTLGGTSIIGKYAR